MGRLRIGLFCYCSIWRLGIWWRRRNAWSRCMIWIGGWRRRWNCSCCWLRYSCCATSSHAASSTSATPSASRAVSSNTVNNAVGPKSSNSTKPQSPIVTGTLNTLTPSIGHPPQWSPSDMVISHHKINLKYHIRSVFNILVVWYMRIVLMRSGGLYNSWIVRNSRFSIGCMLWIPIWGIKILGLSSSRKSRLICFTSTTPKTLGKKSCRKLLYKSWLHRSNHSYSISLMGSSLKETHTFKSNSVVNHSFSYSVL